MKTKTSMTLSPDVLRQVDDLAGSRYSRSAVVEQVLRHFFRERSRRKRHARDLQRINAAAENLNQEVADVLEYQTADQ